MMKIYTGYKRIVDVGILLYRRGRATEVELGLLGFKVSGDDAGAEITIVRSCGKVKLMFTTSTTSRMINADMARVRVARIAGMQVVIVMNVGQ